MFYLADVLTTLRFVVVAAILYLALGSGATATGLLADPQVATAAVLALFIFGELTDAFDGAAARKWPYPVDGKRRFWRRYVEVVDQVADLALGAVTLLYIGLKMPGGDAFALVILVVTLLVAIPIQIWRKHRIVRIPDEDDDPLRVRVILARRVLYLLAIAAIILFLLFALVTDWPTRTLIVAVALVAALALAWFKRDRLQRDKPRGNRNY